MPMWGAVARVALLLSCALPALSHAGDTPHWVHYRLLTSAPPLPKKVLLMPASIKVYEMTAGGVTEEVPDWSAEVSRNLLKSATIALGKNAGMQEVAMPRLSAAEAAIVNEHMALYQLVVNTAAGIDLPHKYRRFDYSIGPGLATLLSKTGADAVVLIYGRDYASTAGRKAKAVLGKIPIVNIFSGGDVSLGDSFVHVGIVDLRTGDLLWMNSERRGSGSNLRDYGDSEDIIESVFEWYPGIEKYRKAYVD